MRRETQEGDYYCREMQTPCGIYRKLEAFDMYGFEAEKTFYKIGDEIEVAFQDGTHCDGILEGIRVEDNAIMVAGVVFTLDRIMQVNHKKIYGGEK